jgi:hypothetical protein
VAESDPNAKTGKLGLDKAALQAFLDERVVPFLQAVKKIKLDDPVRGPSLASLLGDSDIKSPDQFNSYDTGKPLALGYMAQQGVLGDAGKGLNEAIVKAVTSVNGVYDDQQALFEDIVENLRTTIKKLTDTQDGNLTSLDGRTFLEIFEDTVDDLAPSGGSGGGGKE